MKTYSTVRFFKFKNPILRVNNHNDYYYVIDSKSIFYILNKECKVQLKQKLAKDRDLHNYTHLYSIENGVLSIPVNDILMCVKYKNEKIVAICKNKSISDNIVLTTFNREATLLLSCTLDGKVSIFNAKTKSYSYIFEYQPDYLSSALFSENNIFVYIGYFNLENRILNLKNNRLIKFKLDNPIENGTFFDNDTKLFLADREGNSIIYDCITYQVIDKKALFIEWVSCVIVYRNEKYILIGTRKNKLYLLDPFKNELLITIDLDAYGVTSISFKDDKLILSYADSSFQIIDTAYLKDIFLSHINLKEYHEAKSILEQNLFLYADESIKSFELGFDKVLVEAKNMIVKGDIEDAIYILEPFMYNKVFKKEIDFLFMQQDYIASFIEAIEKDNLKEAYLLAQKYDIITSLGAYQNIEKDWQRTFLKAKKVLESESLHGKNQAIEILKPYINIPQKQKIVKHLFTNVDKFSMADKLIKKQDFKNYFILIEKFSFLKETLLYKKVDSIADSLKEKSMQSYTKNNFIDSAKYSSQLLMFPKYSKYAKDNLGYIKIKISLDEFIKKDNIKDVYSLVKKHLFLEYDAIFLKYNQIFINDIEKATKYILNKNISSAVKIIEQYIQIEYLKKKLDDTFKLAYIQEIDEANSSEYDVLTTILRYKELFGIDSSLKTLLNEKEMKNELRQAYTTTLKIDLKPYPDTILSL